MAGQSLENLSVNPPIAMLTNTEPGSCLFCCFVAGNTELQMGKDKVVYLLASNGVR